MKTTTNNPESFTFESYGVPVRVESSDPELLAKAKERAQRALVWKFQIIDPIDTPHVFRLERKNEGYYLTMGDYVSGPGKSEEGFLGYFSSMVRVNVGEYAVGRVFVHAGVVAWKGRAMIIPGTSHSGKTTLVAELLKCGATYYSDEYAVFDENGLVHPFARNLEMRSRPVTAQDNGRTYLKPDELGSRAGTEPIAVGCILITKFRANAKWKPKILTPGQAVLEMISQTIPIRYAPEFSIKVLKKVTANAIIIKNFRFEAESFARFFLDFVDNKAI